MSAAKRAGIRAARTLLSLLEENSVEDFEAAESILGNEQDLVKVLQLLRNFKMNEPARQQAHDEPLSVRRLQEIVRKEILGMSLSLKDLIPIVNTFLGDEGSRLPRHLTADSVLDQVFTHIAAMSPSPREEAESIINLLIASAAKAGSEHMAKVVSLLRDLTIQALTENTILFPTLHALADLRTSWGGKPLPHQRGESRQHLVARLLTDAERLRPKSFRNIIVDLLREGLRSPVDGAIADIRDLNARKKARGA